MFYVKYRVAGYPGEMTAGPYPENDIQYQRDDIAGYEGVEYAVIVPVKHTEVIDD